MTYVDGINAEAMDKFLDALESGEYTQGTHRLHTVSNDAMCCLGVGSAVLGPDCGVSLIERQPGDAGLGREYLDEETNKAYYLLMPPAVSKHLGIPEAFLGSSLSGDYIYVWATQEEIDADEFDDMDVVSGRAVVSVSSLNDQGVTFKDIARRIRETFTKEEN